ncbi:LuxR C-terminal-related transcriptional regulator [Streptomyces sp. ok210]|jgi:DNA-binding NarL/FixJ family response regulator|uniref:helix-turn-helix transcriptional regulator n=1 Tax=Streptomyces sp. ok210 TaxID=1761905 RepID=UPI0008EC02E0|nr:LuxR C-terminal-related transcriptional regulator [Streptomyces sp. ok210]SFT31379.1 regulatory protein, luxR family [Streptomyces sp. ok210]
MCKNCCHIHQSAVALPSSSAEVEDRHKRLITLLATGHTDASAARQLGVSRRTVTYILRSMMDQLGINNRFQLGIAVGTRSHTCASCPAPLQAAMTNAAPDHDRY